MHVHPLTDNYRPSTFELQLLRIGAAGSSLTVLNLYRLQWMWTFGVNVLSDELAEIIASLSSDCTNDIVVCGDANSMGCIIAVHIR